MKKFCIVLLLILTAVTAAGCGRKNTVGICMRQSEEETSGRLKSSLQESLQTAGYTVTAHNAVNDQSRQNRQIEALISEGCDLLIVEPVMTAAAADILQEARSADVPVIFINHAPEDAVLEGWDRAFYIGSDLSRPGLLQGLLVRKLPDGGDRNGDGVVSYTVIAGSEDHVDALHWTQDCGSGLIGERLSADYGDWSRDSGRSLCYRQLALFGDNIEVIFCNSDALALGALEALESGETDVYLVGIGGTSEALKRIREGHMTGTICEDIPALTRSITETTVAILRGEMPQKSRLLDFTIVTKD